MTLKLAQQIFSDCDAKVQLGEFGQFPLVMLVSFPGSGNTWARLLIEAVTGYYTGSVYSDKYLYAGGFIGEKEKWRNGRTILIKNHDHKRNLSNEAKGVVLLVRNPYDAILAEFNRFQSSNHTGSASLENFNSKWFKTVEKLSTWWVNVHHKYAEFSSTTSFPMHVVFYENLKNNATHEMERVLNFMKKNYNFYPNDGLRRLKCLSKDGWYKIVYISFKERDGIVFQVYFPV